MLSNWNQALTNIGLFSLSFVPKQLYKELDSPDLRRTQHWFVRPVKINNQNVYLYYFASKIIKLCLNFSHDKIELDFEQLVHLRLYFVSVCQMVRVVAI